MIIVEENTIIVGAGGGSNVSSLNDLTDVDTTGVSGGDFLWYRAADPGMGVTAGWVPAAIALDTLTNVANVGAPGLGDFLGWDTTNSKWESKYIPFRGDNVTLGTPAEADVLAYIAGDGGWVNHQLVVDDISDIDLTGLSAGQCLVYRAGDGQTIPAGWVPGSVGSTYSAGDGIDITNGEISIGVNNASNAIYELSTSSSGLSVSGPEPVYPLEATSSSISLLYDDKTIGINSNHELYTKSLSVTNSSAQVTLSSIANNTVYHLTASAGVESLTLSSLSSDFEYATIIFITDASTHSFGKPSAWQCVGSGCSGGDFTPEASTRYVLAIVDEDDQITIYVTETPF